MDFDLDSDQQELLSAVATLLDRNAGTERARTMLAAEAHDDALLRALVDGGFCDLEDAGAGPLEGVLVAEAVAAAAGCVSIGARALVGPALFGSACPFVLALRGPDEDEPVRFGAQADTIVSYDDEHVYAIDPRTAEIEPVASGTFFPLAVVRGGRRRTLDVAPDVLVRWWRVALAAEMVGAMSAALSLTVDHLSNRRQFGRPLASFQALRHRLSELHISIEGARWVTRAAAFDGAPAASAASAATSAAAAAADVVRETHQLSGAMGLTAEYDLHVATKRLAALRQECGGLDAHAVALSQARWADGRPSRPAATRPGRPTADRVESIGSPDGNHPADLRA